MCTYNYVNIPVYFNDNVNIPVYFTDNAMICCRTCQEKHWTSVHKVKCKNLSQPPTMGVPFIVSLPKSQCTYRNLADAAEKLARLVIAYSLVHNYNIYMHIKENTAYRSIQYMNTCLLVSCLMLMYCTIKISSPHVVLVTMCVCMYIHTYI